MFHVKHYSLNSENGDQLYLSTKDFMISYERFDLFFDNEKDMLITQPRPSETEIYKYYQSEEYVSHNDSTKGLVNFIYQIVKSYSLRKKERLITRLCGGKGSLLDVGAGTGDFLAIAKKRGWKIAGVEVSEQARGRAKDKGLFLESGLDSFDGQSFDIITLWHVLEHLHDLEEQIIKLSSMLSENGTLIIAVPNFRSFDAQHYGKFWAAYDTPRHLWHFSRNSIKKLFTPKLELIKVLPMYFDAFYVSLLSEKYKTGKSFSLKALWIGFLSNLHALRSKEHSSLIYCLKNKA